jgi:hypothetical protein
MVAKGEGNLSVVTGLDGGKGRGKPQRCHRTGWWQRAMVTSALSRDWMMAKGEGNLNIVIGMEQQQKTYTSTVYSR